MLEALSLPISAFQAEIEPGFNFGLQGVDTTATVGGMVRLRHQESHTEDMALSVFHCFRTIIGEEHEANGVQLG